MRNKLAIVLAGAGLLLAVAPVRAHHAFAAEFDEKRPLKLAGTVTKWETVNPHSWIHLDVKGADGKITNGWWRAAVPILCTAMASPRNPCPKAPKSS